MREKRGKNYGGRENSNRGGIRPRKMKSPCWQRPVFGHNPVDHSHCRITPVKEVLQAYAEKILPPVLEELRETRSLGGVLPSSYSFFAAALFQQQGEAESQALLADSGNAKSAKNSPSRSLVVVTASNQAAESLAAESLLYLPARQVAYLPGFESIPYE